MAERNYRVRIARGDQQFEVEGDKAFVLDMLKRFGEASGIPADTSTPTKSARSVKNAIEPTAPAGKALSAGEFIRQLGFKRHTDIVLAFGYYLEKHSGVADFTPADINHMYYEAKMENSNTSQMCISNVRKSLMMEAKGSKKGGKKRYTVTRSGEEFVKAKLIPQSK